jgi:hypothetical protein
MSSLLRTITNNSFGGDDKQSSSSSNTEIENDEGEIGINAINLSQVML